MCSALVGYTMMGGSTLIPEDVCEKLKELLEKTSQLEAQFSSLKPKQQRDSPETTGTNQEESKGQGGRVGTVHRN